MSDARQWPRRQNESEPVEIALFLRVIVVAKSGVVLRCIRAVVMAPHGDVGPTSVLTGTSRILRLNVMRREKEGLWILALCVPEKNRRKTRKIRQLTIWART
jgi:hypothetical protein